MDSEKEEEKDDITTLREQIAALKLRLRNMDERVAESGIDRMDVDDKIDTLRKVVCSKIALRRPLGTRSSIEPMTQGSRSRWEG